MPRPHGSGGLCTRWAGLPFLPGLVLALPAGRLRHAASCCPGLGKLGFSVSFCLRGAGFNFLAVVCVGGPPLLLPGVRWPLAGVWRAGAVSSGECAGLFWLDLWLASLALVLWCAVVRRVAPCRAVVCRSVPRRVASCCGVLCFQVPCLGALHCGALRCGVPCCLVLWRGGSLEVSLAYVVVRSAGRSVAGWWLGAAVRCGWLAGSVLWGSGCAAGAGWSGRCLWGCPPWWACALVLCPLRVPAPSPGCCGRAFILL